LPLRRHATFIFDAISLLLISPPSPFSFALFSAHFQPQHFRLRQRREIAAIIDRY